MSLPTCPVCSKRLGSNGTPASLPCGHNGCMECLLGVQRKGSAQCPVCHCAFGEELPIAPNTELRDLIALATMLFMDDKEREDGWEAFPNKALTAEQYANDLQSERVAAQPPPFSRLNPYVQQQTQQGQYTYHPTYPHHPQHQSDSNGEAAKQAMAMPTPPSFRGRHHYSLPGSLAGSSPLFGTSPTNSHLPHYPGSYSPLESFFPHAHQAARGDDCDAHGTDQGGETGCIEAFCHTSKDSMGGVESPVSSSPASFSSNALMLAHQGPQGIMNCTGGSHGLVPSAAAAAATAAAMRQLMELLPPHWLPDSMASACGGCHKPFRPLVRLRHHCRCCGRIFCQSCSSTFVLLPPKFNTREPQRACDMCASMLSSLQPYLASTQATAAQPPVFDALDAVSLRTWVNAPYCSTLEGDVFKAANVLSNFTKAARLQPEAGLPTALLAGAKGLVVMSLIKLGAGWSASFGTGVVVSRASDGTWSAPCSVAAYGLGWGFQMGGKLTDLLLVLRTDEAVRAFNGAVHVGFGGNVSVAAGPLGRHADATLMTGTASPPGVPAAAYSYSCSQGAFVGISVEGMLLTVRGSVNRAFYGLPVTANDLLVPPWAMAPPPAAATLYEALADMTRKYENRRRYIHAAPSSPSSSMPAFHGLAPTMITNKNSTTTPTPTASPDLHTVDGIPLLYHHTTVRNSSSTRPSQEQGPLVCEDACSNEDVEDQHPHAGPEPNDPGTAALTQERHGERRDDECGVVPVLVPAASMIELGAGEGDQGVDGGGAANARPQGNSSSGSRAARLESRHVEGQDAAQGAGQTSGQLSGAAAAAAAAAAACDYGRAAARGRRAKAGAAAAVAAEGADAQEGGAAGGVAVGQEGEGTEAARGSQQDGAAAPQQSAGGLSGPQVCANGDHHEAGAGGQQVGDSHTSVAATTAAADAQRPVEAEVGVFRKSSGKAERAAHPNPSPNSVGLARLCSNPVPEDDAGLLGSLHASSPSPPEDPMDGWCFDGVAGSIEGCFEEGSKLDSSTAGGGANEIAVQSCGSHAVGGKIAKAAAAQSSSLVSFQGHSKDQHAQSSSPAMPEDLDMLHADVGEQQPKSAAGKTKQDKKGTSAAAAGHGEAEKQAGSEKKKGARPLPNAGSPETTEQSDAETAVGSYASHAGVASEAVLGSVDSDTSGMERAMSAGSVFGSIPGSAPSSMAGSAPTGGIHPPRKAQVTSKGGKKVKKKR